MIYMTRDDIFPLLDRPRLINPKDRNDRYFYRGSKLDTLNNDEFTDNNIDGEPIYVYEISGFPIMHDERGHISRTTTELMKDVLTNPDEIPGDKVSIDNVETRWVTGGLSDNIGTGIHFGTPTYEHGLTLIMDKDRVVGDIVDIEYNMSFFNEYPEVGAYIHQLDNTAIMQDGEIIGLAKVEPYKHERVTKWAKRFSDIPNKSAWHIEVGYQVEDTLLGSDIYYSEDESVALAENIGLDSSVVGIGAYYGKSTTPHSLQSIRDKELSWDEKQRFDYSNRLTSVEEKAKIMYEDVKTKMAMREDKLAVIILESLNNIKKEHKEVGRDDFVMMYDGEEIITDHERATPFV